MPIPDPDIVPPGCQKRLVAEGEILARAEIGEDVVCSASAVLLVGPIGNDEVVVLYTGPG
jgi:hypothetical protein